MISLAKNADVIVGALELLPSYIAYAAAVLSRKPPIAWVHSDLRSQLPLYGANNAHRLIIHAIYPRFRKVVFPSQSALEGFQGLATLDTAACEVISNPIDIDMVLARSEDALPSWAAPVFGKPTILGVGTLKNAIKGFDVLLKSHALARSRGCDHNLVILGDGPDRNELLQQAEHLQIADSTFLVGFQANPYPMMRVATAIAVPSRFESFSMVVTEAMALGTPVVVASSARGSLEVIENGLHGGMFPAEDAEALASKIRDLIENRELRDRYSARGLERVRSFAPSQIVGRWEQLLWQVAAGNSPGLGALPAE
jgi:glycosyltransferase involved in cell wall biosynthesis